jgi:spore coat polysaccharide biosynthesis predicted glycosyltransferase SpsG
MNRASILFRVDGTSQQGWERLSRCLTFASALQRRRRPTYFLSQLEPRSLGLAIKRAGNHWLEADGLAGTEEDLAETIQEVRRLQPAAVIVDAAEATEEYLAQLAGTGTLIVSLDHLAQIRFPSTVIINPLLGPRREAFEFYPGTQLLLGSRFTLVRPAGPRPGTAATVPGTGGPGRRRSSLSNGRASQTAAECAQAGTRRYDGAAA